MRVHRDAATLAASAAGAAVRGIASAIDERGRATVVLATGNSQRAFLEDLARRPGVDWGRVDAFHLDEYVGIPETHPASFRRYLHDRIVDRVGTAHFHPIAGDAPDAEAEARRYAGELAWGPIDVAFVGVGENGHLAFNEPGDTDHLDRRGVRVVVLTEASRRQQVGEGHFATEHDVPRRAITVTVAPLLRARRLLAIAPEARKAPAVHRALVGPVDGTCPASYLRWADHATLFLDGDSAARLA